MPAPPQTVAFNFSGVKTSTNDRYLQQGELVELVNYRRTVDNKLRKRLGFDETITSAFTGGTYLGPATEMQPAEVEIWRDSASQLWAKAASGAAYYRGTDFRCSPTWMQLQDRSVHGASKPLGVLFNGDRWVFSMGAVDGSGNAAYQLTVVSADGVTKLETAKITAIGIRSYAVCVTPAAVWLFYITGSTTIVAHKFTSITTSPTITTVVTTAGRAYKSIDAVYRTDAEVLIAATSFVSGSPSNTCALDLVRLNQSAGVSAATGSDVVTVPTINNPCCTGVSILDMQDLPSSNVHVTFWRSSATNAQAQLILAHTTISALGTITEDVLDTRALASSVGTTQFIGVSAGYVESNGNLYIIASGLETAYPDPGITVPSHSGSGGHVASSVQRYQWGSGVGVFLGGNVAPDDYLASKPFKANGAWWFLSGFDGGTGVDAQRTFFLRNIGGTHIVCPVVDGEAPQFFFSTGYDDFSQYMPHLSSPMIVDSATVLLPLIQQGLTTATPAPCIATLDFAATYRSSASGIVCGGIPKLVGGADFLEELSPLLAPYDELSLPIPLGDGVTELSANYLTYLYAFIDSRGRVRRSSPRPAVFYHFNNWTTPPSDVYTLTIPCNRHQSDMVRTSWIEIYGSAPGGTNLFLQHVIPNNPQATSTTLQISPRHWTATGERLYTTGAARGVLDNAPLPSARLATQWRERVWLAGTPDDSIWFSRELDPAVGPQFNEVLTLTWTAGTGPITAICPMGFDALLVFRQDAIGLITGPGPDGLGQGNYQVQTLSTKKGTTRPVVEGPLGVYFENEADGRMALVSGSSVTEISQGQEAYTGYVVAAAVHAQDARALLFACTNGKILALDYAHPLPDQPAGTWIRWESATLPPFVGAWAVDGAPVFVAAGLSAEASSWKQGSTSLDQGGAVLTSETTGAMSLAGFMGEFDVDHVTLSVTHLGGDSTYRYTLTHDWGSETHDDLIASTEDDVSFRANSAFHTRQVRLKREELTATGEGWSIDGVALEIRAYGRIKFTTRQI